MPSPPPAPRRGRVIPAQQQHALRNPHAAGSSTNPQPHLASNGFDSSDELRWDRGNAAQDNSASFTFSGGVGAGVAAGPSGIRGGGGTNLFHPASRPARGGPVSASGPPRSRFPDADQIMSRLKGDRREETQVSAAPDTEMFSADHFFARDAEEHAVPGAPGPSRPRYGPSRARLSNSSSFASSPGPLRRVKTGAGSGFHMIPSTPTGARLAGVNADGSYSVVRDEEDANNSGLLDLGPQSSLGRNGDLFGFRKAKGTPIRKRPSPNPLAGSDAFGDAHRPTSRLSDPPMNNADSSVIEHSLPDVPESDEAGLSYDDLEESSVDEGDASLLQSLRLWRQDAMEHHLYDTAIFWGEKVLCMEMDESQRCNDAYFLAKAYFLTHQYSRAERLLMTPLPSNSPLQATGASRTPATAGPEAENGLADDDALQAAIDSTRRGTFLPNDMIRRASARPSLYAGMANVQAEGNVDTSNAHRQPPTAMERKRKDREFTVSGTGTGSESDAAEGSAESDSDKRSQGSQIEERARPGNRADFRRGRRKRDASTESISDAWRQEQLRSLYQVQAQHNANLAGDAAHGEQGRVAAKPLVDISAVCRFLAAKCMVRLGKFGEALDLVGEESGRWIRGHRAGNKAYSMPSSDGLLKVGSSMSHLRGLIHLRLDDLDAARAAFLDALRLDVKNYDAFAALVDGRLIEANEVWSLIEGLQWEAQSNGNQQAFDFIRLCYTARLAKDEQTCAVRAAAARRALWDTYSGAASDDDGSIGGGLYNSLDLLYPLAEDLHARRRYADALIVTRRILDLDAEHEQTLDLHLSCIASLPRAQAQSLRPQLFLLANRLVEEHPDRATSWYAVGTWYSTLSRWTDARTYFSKATLLNPRHLPSWLSFAHSFSKEGESEQAILAYSSVIRNFPDHRYAKVCLGAEHVRTGNLKLARVFLEAAARDGSGKEEAKDKAAVSDVDDREVGEAEVELGVLLFYEGRYDESISLLKRCLDAFASMDEPSSAHTTTRLNLAWAYRKSGKLDEAREMFQSVIELEPENLAAYVGLGMVSHALGRIADAVGWYHEALCIEPRHAQATDLLQAAMDEYSHTPVSDLLNLSGNEHPAESQPARISTHAKDDTVESAVLGAPTAGNGDVFGGGVTIPRGPEWLVTRSNAAVVEGSSFSGSLDQSHLAGVGGSGGGRGGDVMQMYSSGAGAGGGAIGSMSGPPQPAEHQQDMEDSGVEDDQEGSRSMLMDESG